MWRTLAVRSPPTVSTFCCTDICHPRKVLDNRRKPCVMCSVWAYKYWCVRGATVITIVCSFTRRQSSLVESLTTLIFSSALVDMFAFILTPIALVVAANALPALSTRQNPCNALGAGSSSSLSYNFTLAALDVNSIDNSTGTALALTTGPPGTSGEASTWWLSVGRLSMRGSTG